MRRRAGALAVVLFAWSAPTDARAQSFDCTRAGNRAELLVCNNPLLGELDERMARLWSGLDARSRRRESARQSRFLAARDRCGYVFECVDAVYRQRIDTLSDLANDF